MTIERIEEIVCSWLYIEPKLLHTRSQRGIFTYPRYLIIYFAVKQLGCSHKEAMGYFDRDHSTADHGLKVISDYIETDKTKSLQIAFLQECINNDICREKVLSFNERLERLEKIIYKDETV